MTTLATIARNAACNATVDLLDGGTLELQTSADAVVATLTFGTPAFGNAVDGTATANAITGDTDAVGGLVAKGVCKTSGGVEVMTLPASATETVGTIKFTSVESMTIGAGDTFELSSLTHTQPASV